METLNDFYTSKQARDLLGGISAQELKRLADAKKIEKFIPPTNKIKGYYRKEDVNRLAREMSIYGSLKDIPPGQTADTTSTFVDWIGVGNVLTSLQLDYKLYGPEVFLADLSYYAERVKRNPHVALAVYETPKKERILAYVSLLPLPEETIIEVLKGSKHETEIKNDEVETYERKGGYTLLAESVAVDPDHPEQLNTLLKHLMQYWCEQYPDRYITKIYAQAESDKGDVLIQKLFFAPREELAPNAYVLNLARPGASRFVRQFQECIENRRKSLGVEDNQ